MEKQPLNRIKVMLAERMLTIARCLKCEMNNLVRLADVVPIEIPPTSV